MQALDARRPRRAEPPGQQPQLDRERRRAAAARRRAGRARAAPRARPPPRRSAPATAAASSRASTLAIACPTSSANACRRCLGVGGERRARAARRDRAPQLAVDDDRRADARAHPDLAHLLARARRRAPRRSRSARAARSAAPARAPSRGPARSACRPGTASSPGAAQSAQHRRHVRAVEARGHRRVGAAGAARPPRVTSSSTSSGARVAGDQRGHPPQRLDLLQPRLERALEPLVLRPEVSRRHAPIVARQQGLGAPYSYSWP